DESAITAAVNADAFRIDAVFAHQPANGIDLIVEIFSTHVPVDRRPPIPPVPARPSVIQIEDEIAARQQQMVKKILVRVARPYTMHVLQKTGAVNEADRFSAAREIRRFVHVTR